MRRVQLARTPADTRRMEPDGAPKPIASTRADDPALEQRIDAFVVGLGETVDALQDAETAGDFALLAALARKLAAEAIDLGYEPMAEAASRVVAASEERNPEAARKSVSHVTDISQRVRRGHRSAA